MLQTGPQTDTEFQRLTERAAQLRDAAKALDERAAVIEGKLRAVDKRLADLRKRNELGER